MSSSGTLNFLVADPATHNAFTYLKGRGLMTFALDCYEDFAKKTDMPDSPQARNAYLLQHQQTMKDVEATGTPEQTEKTTAKTSTRATTVLRDYGNDYLTSLGHEDGISDDLYAASIASSLVIRHDDWSEFQPLIGDNALRMIEDSEAIFDNPDAFHGANISAESKALHLAQVAQRLNNATMGSSHQSEKKHSLSPVTAEYSENLVAHIDALGLNSEDSCLEHSILQKTETLRDTLATNPVCDPNIVISFPSQD